MSKLKIAYRTQPEGGESDKYDIFVVLATPEQVKQDEDGNYHIEDTADVVSKLEQVRGDLNSVARMLKMANKLGALLIEDTSAMETALSKSKSKKSRKKTSGAKIYGYRLRVFNPAWGYVDGKERWYVAGVTPTKENVDKISKAWRDDGYVTKITGLTNRTTAVQEDILWVPSEPIVSLIPDDPWVGDHLGSHLRKMGLSLATYRDTFNYRGPAVVNKAAASLKKAHKALRQKGNLIVGMAVVKVFGDLSIEPWRIVSISGEEVTLAMADGLHEGEKAVRATMDIEQVKRHFLPVGSWSNR